MTCLSSWVLGSTWLSPPKRFFEVFPKRFSPFVSQSPAVFLGKWLLLQKRFCAGFRRQFFTFVSQRDAAAFKFFGRFRQPCFKCISQSSPGAKVAWIVDMSHPCKSSPQKPPIMLLLLGHSLGLFHKICWAISQKNISETIPQKNVWRYFSLLKSFTIFLGKHWGISSRNLVESLASTKNISTPKTEYISFLKKL